MRYNNFGNTGLFVSELCLGTMTFGGEGIWTAIADVEQDGATALVRAALDAGVNFIDTANVYSNGLSERMTGRALKDLGIRRADVIVATKALGPMGEGINDRGASRYHLLHEIDASLEREIVPLLESEGLGLMVWSPLAGGFLSGKYTRDGEAEGRRATFDFPPVDKDRAYDVIDVMRDVAQKQGCTVAQVALAWLLKKPAVSTVIVGAKRPDQLADNLGAVEVDFSDDDILRLDAASKLAPEYPGWMLERQGIYRQGGKAGEQPKS